MELRDFLNVVRGRRWLIVQAVLIVTLTAVVVSFIQPKRYSAEAKVLVVERDTGAALFGTVLPEFSSQPERGLQTQVQLMQLRPLAEQTIRKLGLRTSPEGLLSVVSVRSLGLTNIIAIEATWGDSETAAAIANTMADEYVSYSREYKRESIKAAADEVESRLEEAQTQIIELGKRISREGKSDELAAELELLTGTYTTLAEKVEQLRINEQLEVGSGRLVSPAVISADPVSPKPARNGVLGLVVGLALGVAMAFLYEYMDNTMKSTEEAEKVYGAPVLGAIPLEKLEKGTKRRLTIIESPGSSAAESYRVLRNSLDFVNFEHRLRTLLITSAAPAEGKSTVAANLAASLAQAGKKVVLVSCDFRRPTTEQFFGVNNMIGLSEVLLGTHSLKAALQRPREESLLILTSGKMPPNPSELLGSTKMQDLIAELEEWADWVIIDTPPLLAVADPASVSRWVDAVLVVSQAYVSTREAASKARQLLDKVGAKIIGVVVWGLEEGRRGNYGYGHYAGGYYYYASYYGAPQQVVSKKKSKRGSAASAADLEQTWVPEPGPGRRLAALIGRALAVVLGFLAVAVVAALVIYFLDQYFAWGLMQSVFGSLVG